MTLAFDVGGCSVLVEPSDQGRKPQPVTAHNRHYVRSLATLNSAHKCRYVRVVTVRNALFDRLPDELHPGRVFRVLVATS